MLDVTGLENDASDIIARIMAELEEVIGLIERPFARPLAGDPQAIADPGAAAAAVSQA